MNCSESQELISAYFDGELAAECELRMSDHLDECIDCAARLAGVEKLSRAASALRAIVPSDRNWDEIQQRLEQPDTAIAVSANWYRDPPSLRLFAVAALLLVAVGVGWSLRPTSTPHSHNQFTAQFGQYLDEFRDDPVAAQQRLLEKYEGRAVSAEQAMKLVGYRPAVANGLPVGYEVTSTHVMRMPCCTCVQTLCQRSDGSTFAIFEHDTEETTQWFGDRPATTCQCGGKNCKMVEFGGHLAASWKRGKRHITLIGVRDASEVEKMVAWLDEEKVGVLK